MKFGTEALQTVVEQAWIVKIGSVKKRALLTGVNELIPVLSIFVDRSG
jgi:hypothetical protein